MRQNFNEENQIPSRKTKMVMEEPVKKSKLPYILLSIAALFVLYFGYNMLVNNSDETLQTEETTNNKEAGTEASEENSSETSQETSSDTQQSDTTSDNPDQAVSNGDGNSTGTETSGSTSEASNGSVGSDSSSDINFEEVIGENLWEPIGTTQQEPHVNTFELDSVDWKEMVQAIVYATKIPEDKLIIWRLQNGGAPDLAIGTVSTYEFRNSPLQVHLKWVSNEGWMPIKVFQLDHNSYFEE